MNHFNHLAGVCELNLVIRKLILTGLTDKNYARLYQAIDTTFGVDKVTLNQQSALLIVHYDATHTSLDALKTIIHSQQVGIDQHFWGRIKASYYQFVDQNILEQKSYKEVSCHHAPAMTKRK
ncbi:hypothetical protein [Psychromonas hadalis]|uniref:hypothetical protein n=1 Tax=Psychromonas hadalis TaxID=211669 RepID=UPI0003B5F4C2|nr:hypothetical protein [Psychromonas hadalis]